MASSSTDPQLRRSLLGLQLRSTRRPQWRGDWALVWFLLLLISILTLSVIMLSNDAVEKALN